MNQDKQAQDPQPEEPQNTGAQATQDEPEGAAPYKNLWVPLVIVPALIVVVMVLIWLFFGMIAGSESSIAQNLDRVLHGGVNERTQAVFELSRQVSENQLALIEGRDAPNEIEENFLRELESAWEALDPEDHEIRMVIASLLSHLGDPEGRSKLATFLSLTEEDDPGGRIRFGTMASLGAMGDSAVAPALLPYLQDTDRGLRAAAAVALQKMDTPEVRAGLIQALSDEDFDVRANAAISLSHMGVPEAAPTLRELTSPEPYTDENQRDRARYKRAEDVSLSRTAIIYALGRLSLPEDRALIETLASGEEEDLKVRGAAIEVLAYLRAQEDGQ